MGSQGSTLQYVNFEDGNLKVLRMVLYLAFLDSHQFLQWQVMNFWVRNLGKPFASVFSWQQSQKSNLSAKMIFSIFLLILASRSAKRLLPRPSSFPFSWRVVKACSKMATKTEKATWIFLEKKGEIRMKRFPSHPLCFSPGKSPWLAIYWEFSWENLNIFFKSYLCKIICSETACTNEVCSSRYPIFAFIHFLKNWVILLLVLSTLVKCNIVFSLSTF